MKPEFDREIDALLRSRAGGERLRGVHSTARDESRASHLDADELAAFAENAMPDAARTRYSAHLADCDDCRRTATQIALAANIAHARDEREAVAANESVGSNKIAAASWRERIAALLAPRAWRYAMPVVALLCVGVIALVVMRRVPNSETQLARNDEESQRSRADSSVAQDEHHATAMTAEQPAGGSTQTQENNANAPAASKQVSPEVVRGEAKASDDQAASQPAVGGMAGSTSSGAPVDTATRRIEELPTVTQPPAATPMPVPPPPREAQSLPSLAAQATPVPVNEDRIEIAKEEKIKKSGPVTEQEQAQQKQRRAQSRDESDNQSVNGQRAANSTVLRNEPSAPAASAGAATKSAPKPSPRRAAPARADNSKDEDQSSDVTRAKSPASETRTVAGRKFRREGDAWIDTAYKSGEATTVVRRNSEQYRALVADEPEIGRVANALGGEVVVVWRGRAYRIKS
jgi:hypothetical protein